MNLQDSINARILILPKSQQVFQRANICGAVVTLTGKFGAHLGVYDPNPNFAGCVSHPAIDDSEKPLLAAWLEGVGAKEDLQWLRKHLKPAKPTTITKEQLLNLLNKDGGDVMLRYEGSFSYGYSESEPLNTIIFHWTDSEGEELVEEVDVSRPLEVRGNVVHLPHGDDPGITDELEIYLPLGSTITIEELCE